MASRAGRGALSSGDAFNGTDFVMISKLPRWIWLGAAILAFVAGHCNAIGLLGFEHQSVSHVTGVVSQFGVSLFGDAVHALHLFFVITSFFAGAVLSGVIVQDSTLRLGRRYGLALLVESALLGIAVVLLSQQSSVGDYCVSCACGLQNAMVSTFSGAVVRTTHLTGTVTDLGILVGHKMRRLPVDGRRIELALIVLGGFLVGTLTGTAAFFSMGNYALLIPAVLTGASGIAFGVYQYRSQEGASGG
jgi:uncharacterized membrane protein YoaK (UPF0700 family)